MGAIVKSLLYLGLYALLHFGYEKRGWSALRPVFGTSESVFEHLKIGFFAYFFASLLEAGITRRQISIKKGFWHSRLLATWSIPWIIVTVWYIAPAIYGKPLPLWGELSWAIAVAFLSGILSGTLERELEEERFSQTLRGLILVLFGVSLFFFVWFSYRLPWIDLFVLPSP